MIFDMELRIRVKVSAEDAEEAKREMIQNLDFFLEPELAEADDAVHTVYAAAIDVMRCEPLPHEIEPSPERFGGEVPS